MATTPTSVEVERALAALLCSHTFAKSGTLRRLLEHLVRNAIVGSVKPLTEASIAMAVFGYAADFNPVENSLVRKTMARLREKLTTYYAGEGRPAEVRIELQRGSYLPSFWSKEEWCAPLTPTRAPRVLLLPFYPVNFHDDTFLADGLLEDLMTALAAGGGIPLVPWTTARYLREKSGDVREYHRVSGAEIILDGSLRKLGEDLYQLTLNWVDGLTAVFDAYLQVRVGLNAIPEAIQSICTQIRQRLGNSAEKEELEQIEARQSQSPEARNFYLRARQANRQGTAEGVRSSFGYLARALELQPDYAAALALKADAHIYAAIAGLGSARVEMAAAIESAERALKFAPRLASALAAKGGVQFAFQWDNQAAAKSLAEARALDPTSDSDHFWSEAVMAAVDGPAQAALRMEQHAAVDNCSASTAYLASTHCYNAREWKRTEHWARKAIELEPGYFRPYPFLAGACLEMNRTEEALATAEMARRISGPNAYTSGVLGVVLARTGRESDARAVLAEPEGFGRGYSNAMGKALIQAALGETQQACDELERMIGNREPYVAWMHVFPFFDSLRGEPSFERLLQLRAAQVLKT